MSANQGAMTDWIDSAPWHSFKLMRLLGGIIMLDVHAYKYIVVRRGVIDFARSVSCFPS
jgi:hypothetical protein